MSQKTPFEMLQKSYICLWTCYTAKRWVFRKVMLYNEVTMMLYSALVIKILSNICEDVHLLVKLQTYRDMQIFNMAEAHTCTRLFFYKQRFFSTQRQCCLTFSWIKPQILLSCCFSYKHHHTEKLFQSRFKSRLFGLHVSFAFLRK